MEQLFRDGKGDSAAAAADSVAFRNPHFRFQDMVVPLPFCITCSWGDTVKLLAVSVVRPLVASIICCHDELGDEILATVVTFKLMFVGVKLC